MIIGIDEVGRGCWAGPLVAAAVEFESDLHLEGLRDSKKMTAKQRQLIRPNIIRHASQYGIGWVWPEEINTHGLTASVALAMERAIDQMMLSGQQIIIDGNYNFLPETANVSTMIKADDSVSAVAAASVLAKLARDEYMQKISLEHPGYGFETHVGYGTKAHMTALKKHGALPGVHRMTYKPILELVA